MKQKPNANCLSMSTTIVDASLEGLEAYSNVDEIGMDGFCLMAGSLRQENACEKVSSLSKECGGALKLSLGKFLKVDKPTTSQDGACLVAIKEPAGLITCLPSIGLGEIIHPEGISFLLGGGNAEGSSSKFTLCK